VERERSSTKLTYADYVAPPDDGLRLEIWMAAPRESLSGNATSAYLAESAPLDTDLSRHAFDFLRRAAPDRAGRETV